MFHQKNNPANETSAPAPNGKQASAKNPFLPASGHPWPRPRSAERMSEREHMVETIRKVYQFYDEAVLDAMKQVPRHWFVPPASQHSAYTDGPLSIGHGQTISQPYIVAFMTSQLDLNPNKKVLEIGAGSGYQAAVLSELSPHVFTIEIIKPLAEAACQRLDELGYKTIQVRQGDGYQGWPQEQPFDAIIATCAPDHIPAELINQLKPGGKLVIPVGQDNGVQNLLLLTKNPDGQITRENLLPVRFVPLTRE